MDIKIYGHIGEGKTAVASMIEKLLKENNVIVKNLDTDFDKNYMDNDIILKRCIDAIATNGCKVTIETVQVPREKL